MNMHLWLRCRKMLVAALVTQIHGIGYMEGITLFQFRLLEYNGQSKFLFINKNINIDYCAIICIKFIQ